jgi:hypothetical protein
LRPVQGSRGHADLAEGVTLNTVIIHVKSIASIRLKVKSRSMKNEGLIKPGHPG